MKNFAIVMAVGALGLAGTAIRAQEAGGVMLKPGDAAPAFSLVGSDGKTYSLDQLKGKPVVVAWFPKAFTQGCTIECKSMREAGDQIRQYDVAYFAASVDDAETNKKFAESLELDFPVLSDPAKTAANAYGVVNATRPVAFRWTFYIKPDGTIALIDKQINTAQAGADTARILGELGVKKRS